MTRIKKYSGKALGIILSLLMILTVIPSMSLTAWAADATELAAETTTWENGDYVVPADGVTISGHITVKGTVNLTLTEGATLTANAGITLSDGATLNVSGEGAMTVNGTNNSTASTVAGNGTLVLTSGTLTAKGGNGQGIGDRQGNQTGANGGTAINGSVIVNGGTLTATGGNGGSVGGSCYNCKGGNGDAAISGNLTVNGGSMTATNGAAGSLGSRPINSSAGAAGASIGGTLTLGKNVTLYDGLYNVLDDNNSSSREYNGDRTQIMHAVYEVTYAVTQITHTPAAAEGTVSMTYGDSSSTLLPGETSLDDVKGKTVTLNITPGSGYRVKSVTVEKPAEATITLDNTTTGWRDGTYTVPAGGLTYSDAITVSGDVTLVLTDGETLTLNKGIGIAEGATLTIQGEGAMNVNGTNSSTASTVAGCTGTLVLTGGTLTAKGGDGQGFSSFGDNRNGAVGGVAINGNVTVEGGTLTATGGNGGSMGSDAGPDNRGGNGGAAISGSLTINGGTVTTTNGSNGTNNTQSWEHSSAGSGGKAVAGTVTDNTGNNTETGGAGNESNPEETAAIIEAEKQTDGSWQFTMPDYSVTLNIKYEEGADKTALNDAITAAETLYNSIKDDTNYSSIASTLKTAIDAAKAVADSETADQAAVDTAKTAITTAKTNAEAAKKDVDDTNAANAVITKINALPAADDVTTANKEAIEAARAAYNALTDDQKKKVDATVLAKLTNAETALQDAIDTETAGAATNTINALPAADEVTTADKDAIEAARKAYNDLTDDQKKKVSDDTLKKLTDAEDALAAAGVSDTINALPAASDVTTADKDDIEAARKAYNDLTDDQKGYVSADTLKKLTDAEEALEVAETVAKINALPASDNVKTTDKADIEAARKAYDDLTDDQKAKVSEDTLKKLTDAEAALKEATDTAAANAVSDTINALPAASDVTTADKDAIEAARKAYDDLTDDQKAKVSEDTLKKLTDAESALEVAKVNDAINALPDADNVAATDKDAIEAARKAYDALNDDQKTGVSEDTLKKLTDAERAFTAVSVSETINALPAASDVTTDDKDAIEAARALYNALDDDQKARVSEDTLKKLTDAEAALKEATDTAAANAVNDTINVLPAASDVTTADKDAIEAARKAYDDLTDDQKAKVSEDTLKKLTDAEAALKEAIDTAAANEVSDTINALPDADKVTTADKDAIEAARKAYDGLTDDQKAKVSEDTLKKLTDAETALAAAEKKVADEEQAAKELAAAKTNAQKAMNNQITVTQTGKKITVKWSKSTAADGYQVYVQYCGKKFSKPVKTIKKNSTTKVNITKINGKKINLKKQFKVFVKAYKVINGKKVKLARSIIGHIVGVKNAKYTNVKTLKVTKSKLTVKVGKTAKVKAKVTLVNKNKKHIPKSHAAKFRYRTSNKKVATVTKSGKIKGIKKGTCTIYVYAINGKMKKVKVTVK